MRPEGPRSRYRFVHQMEVRFRDLDAIGHVNNAVFLTYFESARMAWWLHLTGQEDLRGISMILARAEVDFRSPLAYAERIEIGVGCTSIGRSSFVLEQDMHEQAGGRLVASARKVLVYFDYAANRSAAIPGDFRRRLLAQDPDAATR
ncbi:MAG TPA: thioesterase family protein [Vicinamibacteria bacterium]|nr:thioesterase family protein [Vicinamibacteria bacterium]